MSTAPATARTPIGPVAVVGVSGLVVALVAASLAGVLSPLVLDDPGPAGPLGAPAHAGRERPVVGRDLRPARARRLPRPRAPHDRAPGPGLAPRRGHGCHLVRLSGVRRLLHLRLARRTAPRRPRAGPAVPHLRVVARGHPGALHLHRGRSRRHPRRAPRPDADGIRVARGHRPRRHRHRRAHRTLGRQREPRGRGQLARRAPRRRVGLGRRTARHRPHAAADRQGPGGDRLALLGARRLGLRPRGRHRSPAGGHPARVDLGPGLGLRRDGPRQDRHPRRPRPARLAAAAPGHRHHQHRRQRVRPARPARAGAHGSRVRSRCRPRPHTPAGPGLRAVTERGAVHHGLPRPRRDDVVGLAHPVASELAHDRDRGRRGRAVCRGRAPPRPSR